MTPGDRPSLYRRAGACALVAAPALLLADNLLHPRELAPGHEAEQLTAISLAWQRWQLAHPLGFAAIVVFAAGIAAVMLVGAGGAGLALARMSDQEFAAGGPPAAA